MAVTTLKTRTARAVVQTGTDSDGNVKTANVPISGLSKTAADWDADKFLNIVGALEPCLRETVVSAETVDTNIIAPSS